MNSPVSIVCGTPYKTMTRKKKIKREVKAAKQAARAASRAARPKQSIGTILKDVVDKARQSRIVSRALNAGSKAFPGEFGSILGSASQFAGELGFAIPLVPGGSGTVQGANAPVTFGAAMNYHAFQHTAQSETGSTFVYGMDYIGSADTTDFTTTFGALTVGSDTASFPLIPINDNLFPVLSQISKPYQRYRFHAVTFHFEHITPTIQPGGVYLYFNSDVNSTMFSPPTKDATGVNDLGSITVESSPGGADGVLYGYPAGYSGAAGSALGYMGSTSRVEENNIDESWIANSRNMAFGAVYEDFALEVDLTFCNEDMWYFNEALPQILWANYYTKDGTDPGQRDPEEVSLGVVGDFRLNAMGLFACFGTGISDLLAADTIGKVWVSYVVELDDLQYGNSQIVSTPFWQPPAVLEGDSERTKSQKRMLMDAHHQLLDAQLMAPPGKKPKRIAPFKFEHAVKDFPHLGENLARSIVAREMQLETERRIQRILDARAWEITGEPSPVPPHLLPQAQPSVVQPPAFQYMRKQV